MYCIVTGAAGFIGSKLVEGLNRRGITDVIAVDNLAHADKFRNLAGAEIAPTTSTRPSSSQAWSASKRGGGGSPPGRVPTPWRSTGATCSTTTTPTPGGCSSGARTRRCRSSTPRRPRCTARAPSSARSAVARSRSTCTAIRSFCLISTSKSSGKQDRAGGGLRYFNVYGPNEQHKGRMASVAYHAYQQLLGAARQALRRLRRLRQRRAAARLRLRRRRGGREPVVARAPRRLGVFNCGTGRAQTFNELAAR